MPSNRLKAVSETQVKNKLSEQKEESRYQAGTKISPASGRELRGPYEPPELRAASIGAPKSYRPDREPARTETAIPSQRSEYRQQNGRELPTTSAQKSTSTKTISQRSVDPRSRGDGGSHIDDKPVSRTHSTQNSDESHPKSTPTSSLEVIKSRVLGLSPSLRRDTSNVSQHESFQSNNRPSSQRTSVSAQNTSQDLSRITSLPPSLPPNRDAIVAFVELVEEGDYANFGRFVNAHLDWINNDEVSDVIRRWAKTAVRTGDQRNASRCAKTLALIDACRTLSRARTTYFLSSLIRDDDDSVRQEFEAACAREIRECIGEFNSEQQNENFVDPKSARNSNNRLQNPKKRERADTDQDPRKISRAMPPDTSHDDYDPRTEFPERLSKWFRRGKLFKMWERVARDSEPPPQSSSGSQTSKQSQLTSGLPDHSSLPSITSARINRVRSMYYLLVVQVSGDFCTVLRATRYWYSGLSRKGFNSSASKSSAILYSKESELPSSGQGFKKEPIKIDLTNEGIGLQLPMRIDFKKYQIVKVPTRAVEVGNVSASSTENFNRYCEESML